MKNTARVVFICGLLFGVGLIARSRAAGNDAELGQTTEIINLLKSHYVDRDQLDQKLLNDATVGGLLQAIGRGVQILTPEQAESNATVEAAASSAAGEPLARAEVIDPDIGYIRLADLTEETVAALNAELKKFSEVKAGGYVLDLRFADGTNYSVAAEIASRFVGPNRELFTLRRSVGAPETFRASETPHDVAPDLSQAPLMVLINGRTRGGAEALAGALRAQERGILVGAATTGSAVSWQDIKLNDGRVLRVATAKIELPNDGQVFPGGVAPDIPVKIDPKVEQDAVLNVPTNVTLSVSLRLREENKEVPEAELVKAFLGEAVNTNKPTAADEEQGEIQRVRDVVLQRAVDILKGISVLLSSR
jgi:C-terminal processing protease CtpA/Prc